VSDRRLTAKFFDVVLCISRALDLLSTAFSDHHLRVAYIGARLSEVLGLSDAEKRDIVVAGAMHDVGAISLATRISLINHALASRQPGLHEPFEEIHQHAIDGYLLLRDFPPFAAAANAIRFHHVNWGFGSGEEFRGEAVPLASHILRIADGAAVLPEDDVDILVQASTVREKIAEGAGRLYKPELVAAFDEAASSESFWLDLVSDHKEEIIRARFGDHNMILDLDALYELARLFGKIIDYRSPFTATHSSGVAEAAGIIAELLGMTSREQRVLSVAGFLHDLGKLVVPAEILDKPTKLTAQEQLIVKQHPYYTHRILAMVPGLEEVSTYGALHHERVDGGGYPFRKRELPLGSRVIAVADVFTAVAEDRPYRAGMTWEASLEALDQLVISGGLDGSIVALVREHPDRFGPLVKNAAVA